VPAIDALSGIGASVRPPAPISVTLCQRSEGGATIGWTRRSRLGWRWIDGIDAPLGEEREYYRLTLSGAGGVVRTVETGQPRFDYEAAMIAADGTAGGPLTASVVQVGSLAASLSATALFTLDEEG